MKITSSIVYTTKITAVRYYSFYPKTKYLNCKIIMYLLFQLLIEFFFSSVYLTSRWFIWLLSLAT